MPRKSKNDQNNKKDNNITLNEEKSRPKKQTKPKEESKSKIEKSKPSKETSKLKKETKEKVNIKKEMKEVKEVKEVKKSVTKEKKSKEETKVVKEVIEDILLKKKREKSVVKDKEPKVKKEKKVKNELDDQPVVEKKKRAGTGYFLMNKFTKLFDEDCKDFLTTKCENPYCKYIHNFSKLWKDKTNEEFARRYYALHQDFQVLAPYERKFLGKANLDLMFIMDCTGSMSSWISKCQEELKNIIDTIKEANPYSEVNIGFVGYRDHCDGDNRLTVHPFTQDINAIKDFISTQRAFGGGDLPEDVVGGLDLALKQDWKSKARYAILVADAPTHGKKYHDTFGDSYPNGCPKGLILEKISEEYGKKDIILTAIGINDNTNKMYDIISNSYQSVSKRPIRVDKLGGNTAQFGMVVAFGASSTLSSVTMGNIKLKDFLNEIKKETIDKNDDTIIAPETKTNINSSDTVEPTKITNSFQTQLQNFFNRVNSLMGKTEKEDADEEELLAELDAEENAEVEHVSDSIFKLEDNGLNLNYNIDNKPPNWKKLSDNRFNSICHSFHIPKDRNSFIDWKNPFIKTSNINCEVSMADKPFSEGAMRYAFFMKDLTLDQNMVGKLNKVIKKKENNLESLSKDILSITICQHIAYDFNNRVINMVPDTRLLINFVHAYIYELINYSSDPAAKKAKLPSHQQFISVENYIEGEYNKYNNNAGWINDNLNETSLIAQAFSHFSWQITRGYLMIVDLQGVNGVLTDPQIHCMNNKKFGKGNLGYIGIMKFFMSHICNGYCKQLELIHPRRYFEINKDYQFFVDKFIPPADDLVVSKICDLCLKPYKTKAKELYDKKKKCWDSFCDLCEVKRKETFTEGKCIKCHWKFKSSAYLFNMKREQFPKTCQKCKIDDRIVERKEFNDNIKEEDDINLI